MGGVISGQAMAMNSSIKLPVITQADLHSFHERHFCGSAVGQFSSQFLAPNWEATQSQEVDETWEFAADDDDGLGYYADGVKRTLTDEQIAIFRHSELETWRKNQHDPSSCLGRSEGFTTQLKSATFSNLLEANPDKQLPNAVPGKRKKKKRGKGRDRKAEEQPDLRKRTWDVVDTGLQSLDYDEAQPSTPPSQGVSKRRKVSYDDDKG